MKTIEDKAKEIARKTANRYAIGEDSYNRDCGRSAISQACYEAATEALASLWRSVEDELPPVDKDVLVSMGCGEFGVVWLSALSNGTCKWYSTDDTLSLDNIKYWMPIPEPPKDESE
ncbi:MAG: DUF551 domain-containing protein [Bacteroides sp.]|nr:DUF551 domain-containing protein [Bacteroides sp.]